MIKKSWIKYWSKKEKKEAKNEFNTISIIKRENIIKNNKNTIYLIIKFIFIINLFIGIIPNHNSTFAKLANITLKIKGPGCKYIFGHEEEKTFPKIIFLAKYI